MFDDVDHFTGQGGIVRRIFKERVIGIGNFVKIDIFLEMALQAYRLTIGNKMYLVTFAYVTFLVAAVWNAWVLMLGIGQTEKAQNEKRGATRKAGA